ncbi:MAG: hypothetical protein IJC17_07115 [Clostridia bacterium]|nr:hypothetical protein [Clostridia bacterium]
MLSEFHSFEADCTAPDGGKCRWHTRYALEESEIRRALTVSERRRTGPVRTAVECAIGVVVGAVCLVNYFTDVARPTSTLVIGVLCLILAAAAVLYSPLSVRRIAKNEAKQQKKINLWIAESGLGFGKKLEHYHEAAYEDVAAWQQDDLLVLFPAKNNLIAVPKAAVDEDCWAFLCEKLTPRTLR